MNSPFVIFGAGGLGRELLGWIANCSTEMRLRFHVAAFVSEGVDVGSKCHGIPVMSIEDWRERKPRYVVAIAEPTVKKRIVTMLDAYEWRAETFIHDNVAVGVNSKIGQGSIVCPFCCISTDSTIGSHVLVNSGSGIGHDALVSDYSSLLGNVSVNGGAQIGVGVQLGARSMIYPGKKVGDWAKVGLGSVVLRNVKDKTTVFGNPAHCIG